MQRFTRCRILACKNASKESPKYSDFVTVLFWRFVTVASMFTVDRVGGSRTKDSACVTRLREEFAGTRVKFFGSERESIARTRVVRK